MNTFFVFLCQPIWRTQSCDQLKKLNSCSKIRPQQFLVLKSSVVSNINALNRKSMCQLVRFFNLLNVRWTRQVHLYLMILKFQRAWNWWFLIVTQGRVGWHRETCSNWVRAPEEGGWNVLILYVVSAADRIRAQLKSSLLLCASGNRNCTKKEGKLFILGEKKQLIVSESLVLSWIDLCFWHLLISLKIFPLHVTVSAAQHRIWRKQLAFYAGDIFFIYFFDSAAQGVSVFFCKTTFLVNRLHSCIAQCSDSPAQS